jgi:hypothetical protein
MGSRAAPRHSHLEVEQGVAILPRVRSRNDPQKSRVLSMGSIASKLPANSIPRVEFALTAVSIGGR